MTDEAPPAPSDDPWAVLGIERGSSPEMVERAWRYTRSLYEDGALATYSLLDTGERRALRERVDAAYAAARAQSERGHAGTVTGEPPPERPAPPERLRDLTGPQMRAYRESRGITLRQVAAVSRVPLRTLEDIEEDRLERLPPPVYLRGFLQQYAREVGLDPAATTADYMARLPRK